MPEGEKTHHLAYIRWYQDTPPDIRYHFKTEESNFNACNIELYTCDMYSEARDCIIPVHNIIGRFIPAMYSIADNIYLAAIPINRKIYF